MASRKEQKQTDPTILEANQVIQEAEEKYVTEAVKSLKRAERAAEGCGCRQCKQYYERLREESEDEIIRLTRIPELDHEEEVLVEWAILQMMADEIDEEINKGQDDTDRYNHYWGGL